MRGDAPSSPNTHHEPRPARWWDSLLLLARRLVRSLRGLTLWKRAREWQVFEAIRASVSMRAAAFMTVGALVLIACGGFFVSAQLRANVFDSRRDIVLSDAALRFSSAQSIFDQSTATTPDQIQETARQMVSSVRLSGAGAGAVAVMLLRTPDSSETFRINEIVDQQVEGVITSELRERVQSDAKAQWQSVEIPGKTQTDSGVPGIVTGGIVQIPRAGMHELYIVYSLESDQAMINMVMGVLAVAVIPFVLLVPFAIYVTIYQILDPVRRTASAAALLADGDLDARVDVEGGDELAHLGTAFNNMASSLEHTIHEYDELSRLQQRFVSDVSHELRTPLTTIRMAEEMIWEDREDLQPITKRSAELLHSQVARFESMLADLLEISRYDAQSALLESENTDIRPLVSRVVENHQELAERLGVPVVCDLPDQRCAAEIDARRIERVVRNLLVNAVEHAEGTPVIVTVRASRDAVAVRVRDHGVGMNEETAQRVFDRFYRADPARTRTTGGTGLGLSIAREDVALHGGRLEAWGVLGQGSSFVMTLPKVELAPIGEAPLALWEEPSPEGGEVQRSDGAASLEGGASLEQGRGEDPHALRAPETREEKSLPAEGEEMREASCASCETTDEERTEP